MRWLRQEINIYTPSPYARALPGTCCVAVQLLRRLDNEPGDGEITVMPLAAPGKKNKKAKETVGELVTTAQLKKNVRRVLYDFDDANCLPLARKKIERLGVPARLLEGL